MKYVHSKNSKLWMLPLGVGGVIAIMVIVVVIPMIRSIADDLDKTEAEELRLAHLVEKRTALAALRAEIIDGQLAGLDRVLPSRKPVMPIISALAGTASSSGTLLNSFEFDPGSIATDAASAVVTATTALPGRLTAVPVKSSVDGTYCALMTFLTSLTQTAPLSHITRADIGGQIVPRQEDGEELSGEVETEAYFALPPSDLGKISDPLPELSPRAQSLLTTLSAYTDYSQPLEFVTGTQENRGNFFAF